MNRFLSRIQDAPISYAIYSSLSFLGRRAGGELPGGWFVRALGRVGLQEAAIRQTLYRMERGGELLARPVGRRRFYRLAPLAEVEALAGLEKLLRAPAEDWDGRWTFVYLRVGVEHRSVRERIVEVLRSSGFASLGPGYFVHPRERGVRVQDALRREVPEARLVVVRGHREGPATDVEFATEVWDLEGLARRYRTFLREYRGLADRGDWPPEEAFAARFALVFDFLDIAWGDPELPAALLPPAWPGHEARALTRVLYRRLLPGALTFGRALLRAAAPRAGQIRSGRS